MARPREGGSLGAASGLRRVAVVRRRAGLEGARTDQLTGSPFYTAYTYYVLGEGGASLPLGRQTVPREEQESAVRGAVGVEPGPSMRGQIKAGCGEKVALAGSRIRGGYSRALFPSPAWFSWGWMSTGHPQHTHTPAGIAASLRKH